MISEIRDFGVDGFILRNASFPASGDMDSAYYPGEKSTAGRNTRLAKFVSQVKKSTGVFVAVELSANIALSRNDAPFYGSFASLGDAVVFDTTDRPDGYYVDRNTDYSSMLTLLGSLVHVEECESIIKLGGDESSDHFIRALRSAGYKMVIIDA